MSFEEKMAADIEVGNYKAALESQLDRVSGGVYQGHVVTDDLILLALLKVLWELKESGK